MDKKYQVFVSSTYDDLKVERQKAIESLLNLDCIPVGMEFFPAADEEQLEFIKKIIDNCDYYVLIIGNRYGSICDDGVSYTEKEFDYAVEKGLKVIALISSKDRGSQETDDAEQKLLAFKEKAQSARIVAFWEDSKDIVIETFKGISHAKENYPAIGWMRADKVQNESLLIELNEARKEVQSLQNEINSLKPIESIDNLADLDEAFRITIGYKHGNYSRNKEFNYTWAEYFSVLAPALIMPLNNSSIKIKFLHSLKDFSKIDGFSFSMNSSEFDTIKLQLKSLGLIDSYQSKQVGGGIGLFWKLTNRGENLMLQLRAVKKSVTEEVKA